MPELPETTVSVAFGACTSLLAALHCLREPATAIESALKGILKLMNYAAEHTYFQSFQMHWHVSHGSHARMSRHPRVTERSKSDVNVGALHCADILIS